MGGLEWGGNTLDICWKCFAISLERVGNALGRSCKPLHVFGNTLDICWRYDGNTSHIICTHFGTPSVIRGEYGGDLAACVEICWKHHVNLLETRWTYAVQLLETFKKHIGRKLELRWTCVGISSGKTLTCCLGFVLDIRWT